MEIYFRGFRIAMSKQGLDMLPVYSLFHGKDGFMLLVPAPQDLVTGEPNQSAIATVHIEKYD